MSDKAIALTTLLDEKAIAEVKKAVGGDRTVFANLESASAKLPTVIEVAEKHNLLFVAAGLDDEGNIDESIYSGNQVVLATVGTRTKPAAGEKAKIGIKAVVMFPMPTVESFLDFAEGKDFIAKIVEKEIALVAFRQIRDAETDLAFQQGVSNFPLDAKTYATESGRGSIDMEAYNLLWPGFREMLKSDNPALHGSLPSKEEMYKAIRSKAFAEACPNTAPWEENGLVVRVAEILITAGGNMLNPETNEPDPVDVSSIESWLASRDEVKLTWSAPKEKNFDILATAKL